MQSRLKAVFGFKKNRSIMFVVLMVLCCIILLTPHVLRLALHQNLPIGDSSYKDAIIAEHILSNGYPETEHETKELSPTWQDAIVQPHHLILAIFITFNNIDGD